MAPKKTPTMTTARILLLLTTTATFITTYAAKSQPISAVYVFGDSTVDPGNNNHLPLALFHANHKPYGERFPGQVPTGRFSDGLIAPDFIAGSLGLKNLIPAYLDQTVSDQDLLTGVSFASAGSGLDDQTIMLTHALDVWTQIRNFQEALRRMVRVVGQENTSRTVENAMFLISIGSNDKIFHYYDTPNKVLTKSPPSIYSDFLLSRLQRFIQSLFKLGARKFAVVGLPPLGCVPIQVSVGSFNPSTHWLQRLCINEQNSDVVIYNAKLQSILNNLHSQYPNGRFIFADLYNPVIDMINHPQSYGFKKTLEGCCGTGMVELGSLCNEGCKTCPNPENYLFWDAIHPSQAVHRIVADIIGTNVIPKLRTSIS